MGKKDFWQKTTGVVTDPVSDLSKGNVGDSFKSSWDDSLGGQMVNSVSDNPGGKIAAGWRGIQGKNHDSHSGELAAQQMQANEEKQYGQNQAYSKQIGDTDQAYLGSMRGNVGKYQGDLDQLRGEIESDQKGARTNYDAQIQPRMQGLMETAQKNAAGAMTLQDSMDPNNRVAQSTRDLYNKQGQSAQDLYEKQAQGEGRRGLADTATIQALGMQNMAGQFGGTPMTGGQLQALMGANQANAGSAYSKTLQRTQNLRDQGLNQNRSLQDQGLNQGFARSDLAYNRGLQAQDRYGQSVGNYEAAGDRQLGRDESFRGQRGQNSSTSYGLQQQMADANRGVANAGTMRDMSIYNTHMGGNQANIAAQIAQGNADQARQAQMVTGGLQAGGTVLGAYFGGPSGAAVGGQAGQAAGQGMAPQAQATPQYGNYSNGMGQQMGPPVSASNAYNEPSPGGVDYSGSSPGAIRGEGLGLFGQNPYDDTRKGRRA